MTMPESRATLESALQRILSRWIVVVAFGVGGAMVGLKYSAAHPPRYEAKAVLGVSISYAITESLELVVEDRALSRASGIIQSDDVLSQVLDGLPASVRQGQGWDEPADLRRSVRLDPRLAQWELVTVHEDPGLAAMVSQLWAESAIDALDEAARHAWRAAALIGEKIDLECTRVDAMRNGTPVPSWDCAVEPPLTDPQAIEAGLINETALSRGVVPDLTYELLQDATPPEEPVLWSRGPLVLAGALIGVILACSVALALPQRRNSPPTSLPRDEPSSE